MVVPRIVRIAVRVAMPMSVAVMVPAAQQPGADDVDEQADYCDRDGLPEMDGHWRQEARHGLITDQQCDHCQHDGATEASQVAELAGTEYEPAVGGVAPRVGVGQSRYQHGSRVR